MVEVELLEARKSSSWMKQMGEENLQEDTSPSAKEMTEQQEPGAISKTESAEEEELQLPDPFCVPDMPLRPALDLLNQWKKKCKDTIPIKYSYQKSTFAQMIRMDSLQLGTLLKEAIGDEELYVSRSNKFADLPDTLIYDIVHAAPADLTEDKLYSSIEKNRKLCRSDFILQLKSQQIKLLKTTAQEEEAKTAKMEEELDTKVAKLGSCIKESESTYSDVVSKATCETEKTLEMMRESKSLGAHLLGLQRATTKQEDILAKLGFFRDFLQKLAPTEDSSIGFSDPRDVVKILGDCQDQCLSFIQYSLDTSEALNQTRKAFKENQVKLNKELKNLQEEKDLLENAVEKEKQVMIDLQEAIRILSDESSQKRDARLQSKVGEVHSSCCTGSQGSKTHSLMMLTEIEGTLESLLQTISSLPRKQLLKIYRMKQVEKRKEQKKFEAERKRQIQEERLRTASERAELANQRKQRIRRPMLRSHLLPRQTTAETRAEKARQEKEEKEIFFT